MFNCLFPWPFLPPCSPSKAETITNIFGHEEDLITFEDAVFPPEFCLKPHTHKLPQSCMKLNLEMLEPLALCGGNAGKAPANKHKEEAALVSSWQGYEGSQSTQR